MKVILNGTNWILLQFVSQSGCIWILGMVALVRKCSINILAPQIDIEKVQEMLADQSLSDNAKRCQQFMTNFMQANPNSGPPNLQTILGLISGTLDECLGEEVEVQSDNVVSSSAAEKNLPNEKTATGRDSTDLVHTVQVIKSYFDAKTKQIEDNIMKQVDERLRAMETRQNEKLDEILKLLKDK